MAEWTRPWPQPDVKTSEEYEQSIGTPCTAEVSEQGGELCLRCRVSVSTIASGDGQKLQREARKLLMARAETQALLANLQSRLPGSIDLLKPALKEIDVGPPGAPVVADEDELLLLDDTEVCLITGKLEFWLQVSGNPPYRPPDIAEVVGLKLCRQINGQRFLIGIAQDSMSYLCCRSDMLEGPPFGQTRAVLRAARSVGGWRVQRQDGVDAVS